MSASASSRPVGRWASGWAVHSGGTYSPLTWSTIPPATDAGTDRGRVASKVGAAPDAAMTVGRSAPPPLVSPVSIASVQG